MFNKVLNILKRLLKLAKFQNIEKDVMNYFEIGSVSYALYSQNYFNAFAVSGCMAIPLDQEMYCIRPQTSYGPTEGLVSDELLPRKFVHSIYKFGWCTPDEIQHVFLRKIANVTLIDFQSTPANLLCLEPITCVIRDFKFCHGDFENEPGDGVLAEYTFTWLGFVLYNHVTTGLPHHITAPRVILVHKQFVLGTAMDMIRLPKNYKLGNVVFGDYERDEEECGLSKSQIKSGLKCARAYIEIPPLDITPHPEFTRFGVGNSLALVKLIRPMKSNYVIPICLPTMVERARKKKVRAVSLVDYINPTPKDFDWERLAKKTLKLFTHKECKEHRMRGRLGSEGVTHALCTSGCGVRLGAPIISHAKDGTYQLIGLNAGGGPCGHRSMRDRLNNEPPLYIDVYPYNTWIINVIMAHHQPKPYPQHVMLVDAGARVGINKSYMRNQKKVTSGWSGRTYSKGNYCYKNEKSNVSVEFFYSEKFEVNADPPAKVSVYLKISAGVECIIVCARMNMPNRLITPKIEGLPGMNISVSFQTDWFPKTFFFTLGLDGTNSTSRYMRERISGLW